MKRQQEDIASSFRAGPGIFYQAGLSNTFIVYKYLCECIKNSKYIDNYSGFLITNL